GYLPKETTALVPSTHSEGGRSAEGINERELIFKFLFDMKNDLNALKEQVRLLGSDRSIVPPATAYPEKLYYANGPESGMSIRMPGDEDEDVDHTEVEESLRLEEMERELI